MDAVLTILCLAQAFEVVEFFAGEGLVGKSCRQGLVATAQLEIDYGKKTFSRVHRQNAFDLNAPAGLACLS